MKSDQAILDFTVDLAHQAGEVLVGYFGGTLTRTIKSHATDFATEADLAAEKLILAALKERFPADAILAEESGQRAGTSGSTWIVDPLDGTFNFASGKRDFGVMIARAQGDELQLAVIFNPVKKLLATAQRGVGTLLQGKKITVEASSLTPAWHTLFENLPARSMIDRGRIVRDRQRSFGLISSRGSAAALVLDALAVKAPLSISAPPGKIWDHAPQALLLAEAGLKVTNYEGESYIWHRDVDGFVAALPAFHDNVLSLLKA